MIIGPTVELAPEAGLPLVLESTPSALLERESLAKLARIAPAPGSAPPLENRLPARLAGTSMAPATPVLLAMLARNAKTEGTVTLFPLPT